MGNTFITLQQIAREALPRLRENLVFPALSYRDFSDDFGDMGATVQIRKPAVLTAGEFDQSTGVSYGDISEASVPVTLNKIATVDVAATALESAVSMNNLDALRRDFIEPAAQALAEKINRDGLELYKDIPYFTGNAGTTPASLNDLAGIRKALNKNKVPVSPRYAVMDTEADASLITIPALVNCEKSGSSEALRLGSIGRVFGIDYFTSQAVKSHVTGITAEAGVTLAAATQAGDDEIAISGTLLTGKLVKGDLISIAGAGYTVTCDSAAAANNAIASVKVYPALPALASGTGVTLIGNHTASLAFNPMAFAFVSRPLLNPDGRGVESYVTSYDGISLRVTKGYDQKFKRATYSMDVLYGYKTVYPELAVRVLG